MGTVSSEAEFRSDILGYIVSSRAAWAMRLCLQTNKAPCWALLLIQLLSFLLQCFDVQVLFFFFLNFFGDPYKTFEMKGKED